jgi:hypothetical protein
LEAPPLNNAERRAFAVIERRLRRDLVEMHNATAARREGGVAAA